MGGRLLTQNPAPRRAARRRICRNRRECPRLPDRKFIAPSPNWRSRSKNTCNVAAIFYHQHQLLADGSRQPGRDQPHPGYRQIDLGIPRRRRAPYYTFKSKPEICLCIVILLTSLSAGRWCPRFVLNRFRNTLPVERFGLQSPFERKGFRQVADFVVASLVAELACNL